MNIFLSISISYPNNKEYFIASHISFTPPLIENREQTSP